MKLLKDYDYVIEYHSGNANLAVDVLGRKSGNDIAQLLIGFIEELIALRVRNIELPLN